MSVQDILYWVVIGGASVVLLGGLAMSGWESLRKKRDGRCGSGEAIERRSAEGRDDQRSA